MPMRRMARLTLLGLCAAYLAGCAGVSTQAADSWVDDMSVTAMVKSRLAEEDLSTLTRVRVSTAGGVVRLRGAVDTDGARTRLVELARQVPAVREVVSELRVEPRPQ
jgi:osmotically-inducible protein OsmY